MKAILSTFILFPILAWSQIQSPKTFLGFELGEKFSRHYQVVDYYKHLATQSDKVYLREYGKTYEGRPLVLAFISSEENIKNLEQIRLDNLKRAGMEPGSPTTNIPIIWLSYNVHGNEASATEASIATIYELVKEGSTRSDWLDKAVIVIDPCLNPDGRDRYVNFYWQYGSLDSYNPDPNALEHNEVWPGGRPNHYLFDLNRDWAWQTQKESQMRMKAYNQWLPQIHVDFHEQGINAPYYFAPAAQPFHELITKFQRDFQVEIGQNNASYFDDNGWFYFTKQYFDLLYPSYGDTYPTYSGAIGMTYEQAGHGRAGLGIIKQEGDTLTLSDRVLHHHTAGLSTIEIGVKNADRLLQNFTSFFGDNASLKYKTFVLKYDGNDDKFNAMKAWLDNQGIKYGTASGKGRGYDYQTGKASDFTIVSQDLVINTNQPKATLAHILFEPKTKLVDSVTYDITAWGAPYAYGIKAYATKQMIPINESSVVSFSASKAPEKAYAFVSKWESMDDARFLASLLKANIKVRFTHREIAHKGEQFGRGSLIIARRDNKQVKNFEEVITGLANQRQQSLAVLQTGFMDGGPDIGSADVRYLKKPKIALLGHEGVSSLAFGSQWHFMEQELNYPATVLGTSYVSRVDLAEYDVIVMQSGWYSSFRKAGMESLMEWVSNGGKLIAVDGALNKLKDTEYSSLVSHIDSEAESASEKVEKAREEKARMVAFEDRERDFMKGYAPGAIYKVKMDKSHPLAFGYGDTYYTLKTGGGEVAYLDENNVGIINGKDNLLSGFVGQYTQEDMEETLVFGVENKGRGQIVYLVDNPLFRSFWQNGKLLMVNAMFFVGQ